MRTKVSRDRRDGGTPYGISRPIALDPWGSVRVVVSREWTRSYAQQVPNIVAPGPVLVRDIRCMATGSGNRYVMVWDAAAPPPTNTQPSNAPQYLGPLTQISGSVLIDYGPEGRWFEAGIVVTLSSSVTSYTPDNSAFISDIRYIVP